MKIHKQSTIVVAVLLAGLAWANGGPVDHGADPAEPPKQAERASMSSGDIDLSRAVEGAWRLTYVAPHQLPEDSKLTLTFDGGAAVLFGGCNTITARPRFGAHGFAFGRAAMTRMACAPEVMALENALVETLEKVDLMRIEGEGKLVFYDATNNPVMGATRLKD